MLETDPAVNSKVLTAEYYFGMEALRYSKYRLCIRKLKSNIFRYYFFTK